MADCKPVFEKLLDQGSILVESNPSVNIDERIYNVAFEASMDPGVGQIIWVCYQHNPFELIKLLKENGLDYDGISDKVIFIDMISKMMGLTGEGENITFCSNPTDYNCALRTIDEKLSKSSNCLIIIDNLNGMSSFDNPERFIKIIRNLNSKVSQKGSTVLYLNIKGSFDSYTETSIMASMHKVYDLDGILDKQDSRNISWDNLKKVSWVEVFSLNSPLLFILLLVMLIVNITLITLIVFLYFSFSQ